MPLDTASFGFPVELSQISGRLKKLWETEGQTKSRASILNLAVIGPSPDTLLENTQLVAQLVREHACRAFVVGLAPGPAPKISAWIQAHCHLTKAGAREVCSEQITLLAEGCSEEAYAHALLAHLDYDLPLTLWWQGELPEHPASALWSATHRLIFDSRLWNDFAAQLTALHRTRAPAARGMVWADLNWTRTLAMRQALAQCFDSPDCLPHLDRIESVQIRHAPGSRSTAILLASWLAAQMHWVPVSSTSTHLVFQTRSGLLRCDLESAGTPALSEVTIKAPHLRVRLTHPSEAALLHASLEFQEHAPRHSAFSAGPADTLGLLSAEMIPGSRHALYLRALSLAQSLPKPH
jgi:glucose-6-phosphate dehydrogenase assembly protein OpcA